jgi:hypothetical protein
MKTVVLTLLYAFTFLACVSAADKRHLGGPTGGRFLENTNPKAEFFVEKDRRVRIAFFDQTAKPVPAKDQMVSVVAQAPTGKARLEFEKKGNVLVSKTKLPDGDGYLLVVQVREDAQARPQNYRFRLETHTCGGCRRAEYACTCDE